MKHSDSEHLMVVTSSFRNTLILLASFLLFFSSCKDKSVLEEQPAAPTEPVKVPVFSKDSAFANIAKQVSFGPRVPGSKGHDAARKWLVEQFKKYGAQVTEQTFKAQVPNSSDVRATNIIAAFNPKYAQRVLLAAHWDTRFAADEDVENNTIPFDGADDGGSGVGVLLEIARLIAENPLPLGVDIILFDAEDQGEVNGPMEKWCQGAQHWGKNPHVKGYRANYGILLDMVGAKGAVFPKENLSGVFPPGQVSAIHQLYDKVWGLAKGMNHGSLFVDQRLGPVTDDHYFVNLHTQIPMIDIIHRNMTNQKGFGSHWHTHQDGLDNIDPQVLGAVGQVVTAFVYNSSRVK